MRWEGFAASVGKDMRSLMGDSKQMKQFLFLFRVVQLVLSFNLKEPHADRNMGSLPSEASEFQE